MEETKSYYERFQLRLKYLWVYDVIHPKHLILWNFENQVSYTLISEWKHTDNSNKSFFDLYPLKGLILSGWIPKPKLCFIRENQIFDLNY